MAAMWNSVEVFFVFLVIISTCRSENIPGVVSLNSGTFDKVVEKFPASLIKFDKPHPSGETQKAFKAFVGDTIGQSKLLVGTVGVKGIHSLEEIITKFKAVLVKFDESYPYGDHQDEFKKVAQATVEQDDLMLAEIHIADYGDKENGDLAERFNVKKEDFPKYKMFIQGKKEPIDYTGDVKKADDIKRFIMQETGLWLGLPACIEEFDQLSREFLTAKEDNARAEIIKRAETEAEKQDTDIKKERAAIYVKTMQKVVEKGEDFIDTELIRVEKLREGKVSDKKKEQLKDRSNILTVFQLLKKEAAAGKEEL